MAWKKIESFTSALTGKYVHFVANYGATNLSASFKIQPDQKTNVPVTSGCIGLIYQVRGGTIFIGFGKDMRIAPSYNTPITSFPVTIELHISYIDRIEVDI